MLDGAVIACKKVRDERFVSHAEPRGDELKRLDLYSRVRVRDERSVFVASHKNTSTECYLLSSDLFLDKRNMLELNRACSRENRAELRGRKHGPRMTSEEIRNMTIEHAGNNHHVDPGDSGFGSGFFDGGLGDSRGEVFGSFGGPAAAFQAKSRRVGPSVLVLSEFALSSSTCYVSTCICV